jgi:ADP-heptose:LPS heptosyltransferase
MEVGDLVCATPALRALHGAYPQARLTLVGLPSAREFVERSPYLHDFIEFPGWEGVPERGPNAERLAVFQAEAQLRAFDIGVQLHDDGHYINDFLPHLGARRLAGFVPAGARSQSQWFVPYPEALPESLRLLRVAVRLGAPFRGADLDFPVSLDDRADAARLLVDAGAGPGPYICVHLGAREASQRWPLDCLAETIERLARHGYTFVLTGVLTGPGGAQAVAAGLAAAGPAAAAPIVDLTGHTSLGSLGAIVEGARLLITTDTGASHIADALGTPCVVLSTRADPERWAPLQRSRHTLIRAADPELEPAGHRAGGAATATATLPRVSVVDEVVGAAEHHLGAPRAAPSPARHRR